MAPMPLTGTIGTTSSLKSDGDNLAPHRRSLPEPVVSFHLPAIQRAIPQLEKRGRKSAKQEQVSLPAETNGGKELNIESSLILLQSLRQSRLIHLTALLPYLSTRHRTSIKYHPAPPGHPFPGGLDPSTTSHSLIHLGRADVRTGPLVFPKTRFGEVRVEGGAQDAKGAALMKAPGRSAAKKNDSSPSKSAAAPPSAAHINDDVVKAVSLAAQKDSKLQALLHTAANGKATPDELRELAVFIQLVSAQLKEKGGSSIPAAQTAKPSAAGPSKSIATTTTTSAPVASTSASATATPNRLVPPPQQMELPSYPPIVTVEYRENPSARFILPLWRGCAVERISKGGEKSIKLTMLLPAIGSTAAVRADGSVPKYKEGEDGVSKTSPTNPPTQEQLTAPAPKGAETHAVTWLLSGNTETPLSDGIWQVFGRVSGATTVIDGEVVKDKDFQTNEQVVQQFVDKMKASMADLSYTPRLRLDQEEVPRDLADHLTDKFIPRMQTLTSKPIVKLKRGDADEDDVEIVRDTSKRGRVSGASTAEKRKRTSTNGSNENDHEDSLMSIDEGGTPSSSSKPKRKRHVAKHNPDGTLKLCQACGTNSTPMWRRGPSGKSTLCNACGAKWKVGRLIVSGDATAIAGAEETSKSAEVQSATASPVAATSALPSA